MGSWERHLIIVVVFVALRMRMLAVFPAGNLALFGDYAHQCELDLLAVLEVQLLHRGAIQPSCEMSSIPSVQRAGARTSTRPA